MTLGNFFVRVHSHFFPGVLLHADTTCQQTAAKGETATSSPAIGTEEIEACRQAGARGAAYRDVLVARYAEPAAVGLYLGAPRVDFYNHAPNQRSRPNWRNPTGAIGKTTELREEEEEWLPLTLYILGRRQGWLVVGSVSFLAVLFTGVKDYLTPYYDAIPSSPGQGGLA